MSLYQRWVKLAYDQKGAVIKKCWDEFTPQEKKIYETLLSEKTSHLEGTIKEFADRFHMRPEFICGFLDGINEALNEHIDIESLEEDSAVVIDFDFMKLFQTMVDYKAEELCRLPQWYEIFDQKELERIYKEQRNARTVKRGEAKIGRNDPCPCGSGKKYKNCCAAGA